MIKRTPMLQKNPSMNLDAQRRELTEDIPHFFALIVNDVSGPYRGCHPSAVPSHWHPEMEVFLLLEGQAQMGIGDKLYSICAGDAYFINSGALHSFAFTQGDSQYRSFLFDAAIVAGSPGSVFDTIYVRPLIEQGPAVIKFSPGPEDKSFFEDFRRVFEACQEEPPAYEFLVREALSRMVLLARQRGQVAPSRQVAEVQEDRVKAMLKWMEEHLREPVTLGDIAGQVNICPRACQKAFQRYLHCSPMEYLQRRRVFAAAERLSLTDEPVTAIALDCGFSSPSYFAKQFKAQTGSTPMEYRAAVRQSMESGAGGPPPPSETAT